MGEDIDGNEIRNYNTGWEQIKTIDHRWLRGRGAHAAKCTSLPPKTTLPQQNVLQNVLTIVH
jgi:hypothetical protein